MKKTLAFLSLTILSSSLQAAEAAQVNVQQDGNIFYDANKYPNGVNGIATCPLQMAMDANGVMFDQDETLSTRLRLAGNLRTKKAAYYGGGLLAQVKATTYVAWVMKKGLEVKAMKKSLQKAGDNRGYCSDAVFLMMSEQKGTYGPELLQVLRDSALEVVTPNLGVAHMLKKLHEAGHHVAILSNMGNSLLELQTAELHKKIKSDTLNAKELEASKFLYTILSDKDHNVVANSITGIPHKPDDAIYQEFLRANRREKTPDNQVTVLVDDKLENIEAAVKNGYVGIFCKKYEAADAMRDALPKLTGNAHFF